MFVVQLLSVSRIQVPAFFVEFTFVQCPWRRYESTLSSPPSSNVLYSGVAWIPKSSVLATLRRQPYIQNYGNQNRKLKNKFIKYLCPYQHRHDSTVTSFSRNIL